MPSLTMVRIVNERQIEDTEEAPDCMIRDGVVVVQKDVSLPDGWRLK